MKPHVDKPNSQLSRFSNLNIRVALAMLLTLIALTTPLILAEYAHDTMSLDKQQQKNIQSVLVTFFIVLGIWQMRVHIDRGLPKSIGLGNFHSALLKFLLGFCLLVVPSLITLLVTVIAGWGQVTINWQSAQPDIILLAMLSVFLTDALPEELIFRGYIFSNLVEKYTKWQSAVLTTILFVLFPVILFPIQKLLGSSVLTGVVNSVSVGYLTYMIFFGVFALYLRVLTKSIWTGVGFHLMFVFMNQLIGLESTNLIQVSELSSEVPVQITLITLLGLTFIALIAYPKIKGVKL